jgi:hypothetical protein
VDRIERITQAVAFDEFVEAAKAYGNALCTGNCLDKFLLDFLLKYKVLTIPHGTTLHETTLHDTAYHVTSQET